MHMLLSLSIRSIIIFCVGCEEGDIQLINGTNTHEGIVNICESNEWRRICTNNWDNADARVVCRQLGFPATGLYSYWGGFQQRL